MRLRTAGKQQYWVAVNQILIPPGGNGEGKKKEKEKEEKEEKGKRKKEKKGRTLHHRTCIRMCLNHHEE